MNEEQEKIRKFCEGRGIKRLCHFTQSRNLAHILLEGRLYSTKKPEELRILHHTNDCERYDRCVDHVFCSIQYPNACLFDPFEERDSLFRGWAVLFLDTDLLWQKGTLFCQTNASTDSFESRPGPAQLESLFADVVVKPDPKHNVERKSKHLRSCPTCIQAEVLVPNLIDESKFKGIVFDSEERYHAELDRLDRLGLRIDVDVYICSDMFKKDVLKEKIREGKWPRACKIDPNILGI